MSLMNRLKAASTISDTAALDESKFLDVAFEVSTVVAAINIALGGSPKDGLRPGLLMLAGPSKHFKTNMALVMAAAFQKEFSEGVILFYDSEFGATKAYFKSAGIDNSRVMHTPITNVEELKQDIMNQLEGLSRKDKVLILIDSIGNLASLKEVEDAINKKTVTDMTRAKALKSLFRMVTPFLTKHAIPLIAINHSYQTLEMFPKSVVGGGTGGVYSSNDIWIIGKQQEKDGDKNLSGWTFIINIEKSRRVKEKSKIPVTVLFNGGIQKHSGLLEWGMEFGFVVKPKNGWYARCNPETGEIDPTNYREKQLNYEWFKPMLESALFTEKITEKFRLPEGALIADDEHDLEDDEGEYDE